MIVKSVKKYLKKNHKSTGIKSIYLCDVRSDTLVGFSNALKKEYGAEKVTFVQKVDDGPSQGYRRQASRGGAEASDQGTQSGKHK